MSRAWSPPLDVRTRTLTTLSVVRARPEHLKAVHEIQVLAYPELPHFHEGIEVFQSKLETYPAGSFIALATTSVVTDDDTLTWCCKEHDGDDHDDNDDDTDMQVEAEKPSAGQEGGLTNQEDGGDIHEITVVEITETGPDGTTTTATSTTVDSGDSHISIVRARTPDILEEDDDDDVDHHPASSSSGLQPGHYATHHTRHKGKQHHHHHHHHHQGQSELGDNQEEDDHHTTILFQWEEPVGYLFSHPYSPESVTLHRVGGHTTGDATGDRHGSHSKAKKMRLDDQQDAEMEETGGEDEDEDEENFEHDQLMEKYFIHDCAIHPAWRGKGLAAKLLNALEESLIPGRSDHHHGVNLNTDRGHRRGAPNLKEITLVSVQGTRPFWERAGGFRVVKDHDVDLSVYGDAAFLMSRPFTF